MRDLSQHLELLSLNTATVRKQAPLDRIIEACGRARHRHDRSLA